MQRIVKIHAILCFVHANSQVQAWQILVWQDDACKKGKVQYA